MTQIVPGSSAGGMWQSWQLETMPSGRLPVVPVAALQPVPPAAAPGV